MTCGTLPQKEVNTINALEIAFAYTWTILAIYAIHLIRMSLSLEKKCRKVRELPK
ncbi:MAG: hypothetical protein JW705_07850 [Methanosarcinaceae archaeon]|nr:hypothetical protein [Methanosarcinaceae archaeon]